MIDSMDLAEISLAYFPSGSHDGPGWYYWYSEYPEEGSVGAFATEEKARAHAKSSGVDAVLRVVEAPATVNPLELADRLWRHSRDIGGTESVVQLRDGKFIADIRVELAEASVALREAADQLFRARTESAKYGNVATLALRALGARSANPMELHKLVAAVVKELADLKSEQAAAARVNALFSDALSVIAHHPSGGWPCEKAAEALDKVEAARAGEIYSGVPPSTETG